MGKMGEWGAIAGLGEGIVANANQTAKDSEDAVRFEREQRLQQYRIDAEQGMAAMRERGEEGRSKDTIQGQRDIEDARAKSALDVERERGKTSRANAGTLAASRATYHGKPPITWDSPGVGKVSGPSPDNMYVPMQKPVINAPDGTTWEAWPGTNQKVPFGFTPTHLLGPPPQDPDRLVKYQAAVNSLMQKMEVNEMSLAHKTDPKEYQQGVEDFYKSYGFLPWTHHRNMNPSLKLPRQDDTPDPNDSSTLADDMNAADG
jgi:hypothetical protein